MYKVQTMNAIAESGLDVVREANIEIGPEIENPDALLIRSAKLHNTEFNSNLLCIGRAGIGVDNVPIDRCTEQGIAVFNTPGANADAVKELVVCSLMMASRDISGAIDWVQSIADKGEEIPALVEKGKKQFVGPEISRKKLGIIGLGAIGARVARCAIQLEMDVYGYDPFLSVDAAWSLSSKVKRVTDLDMLFRTCDYITVHVHCTDETRHMFNAEAFSKMKPGMRIINLARGELVDDDAMIDALADGTVARYITDFPNAKLANVKNVVAYPHLGASTPEAEEKCAVMAAKEIVDYLQNGNVRNSVNFPATQLDRVGEARLCVLHKNQPKMLNAFLQIIGEQNANVEHMINKARGDNAYTIFDTDSALDEAVAEKIRRIDGVKMVRLLY